jgi:hypothetical protein
MPLLIRRETLQHLLNDKECLHEMDKAKTWEEVQQTLVEYAKKHGIKVECVRIKETKK